MRWTSIVVVALVIGFAYWVEPDTVRIVEDGSTLQMIGRVRRSEVAPPSACMMSLPINGGSGGVAVYTPCSVSMAVTSTGSTSSTFVTTAGTWK